MRVGLLSEVCSMDATKNEVCSLALDGKIWQHEEISVKVNKLLLLQKNKQSMTQTLDSENILP